MEIKGQKVLLRDFIKEDIADRINWETVETEWLEWDAPWEMEEESFNPEKYRSLMNKRLSTKQDPNRFRYGFQICINDDAKKHIGWVNAYHINDDYCYTDGDGKLTIGINIPDLNSRRRGYATEAWSLSKALILSNIVWKNKNT
jgi:RimJ/RimL family protein N-acetyltransferase